MRLAALVPLGFLGGAALCARMLRHAPPETAVDRAQPLVVVTYWQHFGAQMWVAFALAIAIAAAGYIAALRSAGRCPGYGTIVVWSAAACAAALVFPVVFSSDVYAYAGYGDMALHGMSPYAHAGVTARDPLLDAMLWQWGNPPPMCVYGPAFVLLAKGAVALFLQLGAAAPLWALRILSCIALVACAPLAYEAFAAFPQNLRLTAAAGIALNPIAIWSAAEGHNDTLALAIVLGGFALAARNRPFAGALVIALSGLIKAQGIVAALALAAASWHDRPRFLKIAAGTAAGIAAVLLLAVPLEYGLGAHLAPQGRYFPQFSPQYVSPAFAIALAALFALFACTDRRSAAVYLAFAAWAAVPNPYPWYAVWLLPVAFLAWPSKAGWALVAASLLIAVRFYPDATTDLSRPLSLAIVAIEFALPAIALIAHMASARRGRPEIHMPAPGFATPRSP